MVFFDQLVRKNNDAWGWHNRINERAVEKLNLCELVPKLNMKGQLILLGNWSFKSVKEP
jgi:hypothetical protein